MATERCLNLKMAAALSAKQLKKINSNAFFTLTTATQPGMSAGFCVEGAIICLA